MVHYPPTGVFFLINECAHINCPSQENSPSFDLDNVLLKPLSPGYKSYMLWKWCGLKMSQQQEIWSKTAKRQQVYFPIIPHSFLSVLFHVTKTVLPHRQSEHFQTSTRANFPFPRRCAANNSWRVPDKTKAAHCKSQPSKDKLIWMILSCMSSVTWTHQRGQSFYGAGTDPPLFNTQRGFWK